MVDDGRNGQLMYDLIGDIHGHADELVQLLDVLGYEKGGGVYHHPDRRLIFLGDFIDRGPQIRRVLEIVRPMVEAGHACWDERAMSQIADAHNSHGGVTTEFLHSACRKGNPLFASVEVILKGKEGKLPDGASFEDKDGHVRTEIRTRWYMAPVGHTYRTFALQSDEIACDLGLDQAVIDAATPYPATAKPVV